MWGGERREVLPKDSAYLSNEVESLTVGFVASETAPQQQPPAEESARYTYTSQAAFSVNHLSKAQAGELRRGSQPVFMQLLREFYTANFGKEGFFLIN